jgi:hypothetical protein
MESSRRRTNDMLIEIEATAVIDRGFLRCAAGVDVRTRQRGREQSGFPRDFLIMGWRPRDPAPLAAAYTLIGVQSLASNGMLIEIEATAVID